MQPESIIIMWYAAIILCPDDDDYICCYSADCCWRVAMREADDIHAMMLFICC
jgi:hypothetical protein